ncbi:MAG TPA: DUF4893 domain-containing protein [Rhizomicrobium sp.]|jgi:hypothetical protein
MSKVTRRAHGLAASAALTFVLVAAGSTFAQAGWQDQVSRYDSNRLSRLDEARAKGLDEARAGRDIGLIHAVLDRAAVSVPGRALAGNWQCRTIKLGGMTPDVVYGWFHCRIGEHQGRLVFEKVSGTQRLAGGLYPHESGGYVLLGGFSVKGEPAHRYSGRGGSAGAAATPDDAVGLLQATGRRSARIEFPYPVQESTFDVIELRR